MTLNVLTDTRAGGAKQHKSNTEMTVKHFWTQMLTFSLSGAVKQYKTYSYSNIHLTLKVLNFWKFTSYCSLKPLWSGMGEVVPARTSPTLHPPSPPNVHQLSRLAL